MGATPRSRGAPMIGLPLIGVPLIGLQSIGLPMGAAPVWWAGLQLADGPGDPQRPVRVLIAGGGTAGHIEPALAVADALREIAP